MYLSSCGPVERPLAVVLCPFPSQGGMSLLDQAALVATPGARLGAACPSTKAPATVQRTNAQLVQDVATRADAWAARQGITGTPQQIGIAKHGYAQRLLDRYQAIFGDRGLQTEISVINRAEVGYGTSGSVRLDVLEGNVGNPTAIYDYKFGTSGLTPGRIGRIEGVTRYGTGVPVLEVGP